MKNTVRKISKAVKLKISSRRGESLTEVLVALLIASLAMAMLAGMIQASVKITGSAESKMQEYYTVSNALAIKDTDPEATYSEGTIGLKYKNGSPVRLIPNSNSIEVFYFIKNFSETDLLSYKRK
ncbi:MAG TPA: prepilin-type N-terminal cleavage/methylation domain-containing protein [Bacillota bacterium]|nr:prepilin-type N-terminal cleavage/methylation domain-containing protein [Bacillota bacterium]